MISFTTWFRSKEIIAVTQAKTSISSWDQFIVKTKKKNKKRGKELHKKKITIKLRITDLYICKVKLEEF